MRKFIILIGYLVLMAVGAALATAPDPAEVPPFPDSPMAMTLRTAEVRLVLEEQRTARAALEQEYRSATNEAATLAVQRRMEDLARQTEWRILGIKAAFLRADGRVEEAEAIEDAVKQMQAPVAKRQPVDRPRPDDDKERGRP